MSLDTKRMCQAAWTAPEPRTEPRTNPWADTTRLPLVTTDGARVAFVDPGHHYFLQDDEWAYPESIISCSKLSVYWKKTLDCGHSEDPLPLLDKRLAAAWGPRRYREGDPEVVPEVRAMVTGHLNRFRGPAPFSFAVRSRSLLGSAKKSHHFHIHHRSIRALELWILRGSTSVEGFEDVWGIFLRYLRDPARGFELVTAKGPAGQPLSAFLEAEWERMGCTETMSETDAAMYAGSIPALAGTLAHEYIEKKLVPARGAPPLPYEAEDAEAVDALFSYLAKRGVTFDAENVERRLGSFRYKLCGTLDAMRLTDGGGEVWDWKRSSQVEEWIKHCRQPDPADPHHLVAMIGSLAFSSPLMGYCIQLAGYRQLELLNNPEEEMRTSAFLGVFHPSLSRKFVIIELPLEAKMGPKAMEGAKEVYKFSPDEVGPASISPIEYVQCVLERRHKHLEQHFKA